jgi:RIO kinase 1
MHLLYQKAKLIHGDLSEYNILIHKNQPVIIDFPQAIDIKLIENRFPKKLQKYLQILRKDIQNIRLFFERKYQLSFNLQEAFEYIAGADAIPEECIDYPLEDIISSSNKLP